MEQAVAQTFTGEDAAELAVVTRNGFVESRHLGSAVVVSHEGEVLAALGNPAALVFPRSTLKSLQALTALEAGADLDGERLAIACASHAGTPAHVAVVNELLGRVGLDARALQCPAAWPNDRASRDALIRAGEGAAPVFMECSGKHAGFLAACVAAGWPLETYLQPEHPLQQLVAQTVARFGGEQVRVSGVDGCGAPVFAMSLVALARAMSRFATAQASSPFGVYRNMARLWQAVLAHPWTIVGPGRPDTVVIERLGVFAKSGAEGVQVLVAPDGTAVAAKVLDGSGRAAMLVALQLLLAARALDAAAAAEVLPALHLDVLGGGTPVGRILLGRDVPSSL